MTVDGNFGGTQMNSDKSSNAGKSSTSGHHYTVWNTYTEDITTQLSDFIGSSDSLTPDSGDFNVTQLPPKTELAEARIVLASIMIIIMMIAFVANFLVLLAIARNKILQRLNNYLIISLSISDFAAAMLCMPFLVIELMNDFYWVIPESLCKPYIGLEISFGMLTVFTISAISFERVFIITNPMLYQRVVTETRMILFILIMWCFSFTYGMLQILWFTTDTYLEWIVENEGTCRYLPYMAFAIVDLVIGFIVPLAVMMGAYTKIFRIVNSQMKRIIPRLSQMWEEGMSEMSTYQNVDAIRSEMFPIDMTPADNVKGITMATNMETSSTHLSEVIETPMTDEYQGIPLKSDEDEIDSGKNQSPDPSPENSPKFKQKSPSHSTLSLDQATDEHKRLQPDSSYEKGSSANSVSLHNVSNSQYSSIEYGSPKSEDEGYGHSATPPNSWSTLQLPGTPKPNGCDLESKCFSSCPEVFVCNTQGLDNNIITIKVDPPESPRKTIFPDHDPLDLIKNDGKHNENTQMSLPLEGWLTRAGLDDHIDSESISSMRAATPDSVRSVGGDTDNDHDDSDVTVEDFSIAGVKTCNFRDLVKTIMKADRHRLDSELSNTSDGTDVTRMVYNIIRARCDTYDDTMIDSQDQTDSKQQSFDNSFSETSTTIQNGVKLNDKPVCISTAQLPDKSTNDVATVAVHDTGDVQSQLTNNECHKSSQKKIDNEHSCSVKKVAKSKIRKTSSISLPEFYCIPAETSISNMEREVSDTNESKVMQEGHTEDANKSECQSLHKRPTSLYLPQRDYSSKSDQTKLISPKVKLHSSSMVIVDSDTGQPRDMTFSRLRSISSPTAKKRTQLNSLRPTKSGNNETFKLHPVLKKSKSNDSQKRRGSVVFKLYDEEFSVVDGKVNVTQVPQIKTILSDGDTTGSEGATTETSIGSVRTNRGTLRNEPASHRHTRMWAKRHFDINTDFMSNGTSSGNKTSNAGSMVSGSEWTSRRSRPRSRSSFRRRIQENKAIRMTATVIGTFIVCWMPYEILFLIRLIGDQDLISEFAWNIVTLFMFLSSAINPFIYNFYSHEFRKATKRALICSKNQVNPMS